MNAPDLLLQNIEHASIIAEKDYWQKAVTCVTDNYTSVSIILDKSHKPYIIKGEFNLLLNKTSLINLTCLQKIYRH